MFFSIIRLFVVSLATSVVLLGCGGGDNDKEIEPAYGGSSNTFDQVLSLSASPVSDPSATTDAEQVQRFQDAFELSREAGARGQFISWRWSELEPAVGQYNAEAIAAFKDAMAFAEQNDQVLLGLQVINTVTREVPAELANLDWDSSAMIAAFTNLLDQLLPDMVGRVTYLSIGNEVDIYLAEQSAQEQISYRQFVTQVQQYLASRLPQTQIGITISAEGWLGSEVQQWQDLTASTDVIITTYYPLQENYIVRTPIEALADIPDLLSRVTDKNWVFQEVGYPSSPLLASSETYQAEFVRRMFAAWRDSEERIPFMNWFLLHDLPTNLVDELVLNYDISDPFFRAFLDSLGLRTQTGVAKSAWSVLVEEGQNYR